MINDEFRFEGEAGSTPGPEVPEPLGTPDKIRPVRGLVAAVLGWGIPGLGHVWLGDRARGAIFCALLLALFFGGIGLHGQVYRPGDGDPLTTLASVGAMGIGAPYLAAWGGGWGEGSFEAPYFEYGSTFTLVAGLLNMLIVLDAFDLGSGRRK